MRSTAEVSRPFRGARLWSAWVLANASGELFGLAIPALTGLAIAPWDRPGSAASTTEWVVMVIAGACEGLIVGGAQWLVLRRVFRGLGRGAWLAWTAGGAAIAWALGMIPSLVMRNHGSEYVGDLSQISDPSRYLLAAFLGAVFGAILGIPQYVVLRRHVRPASWWIPANALAWMFGMPVLFWGAHFAAQISSLSWMLVIASSMLVTAGALVGALHGMALVWLADRACLPAAGDELPHPEPERFQEIAPYAHRLLNSIPLHSLDRLRLAGGPPGLTLREITAAIGFAGEANMEVGRATQGLFWLRGQIGRILRWDKPEGRWDAESFIHRLTPEDRARSLIVPGTAAGISRILFQFNNEMVGEIINRTVHCFWLIAVEPLADGYDVWFAVYVKNRNWFTPVYMTAISPLLKWIIYPAMLRGARQRWEQLQGQGVPPATSTFRPPDQHAGGGRDVPLGPR